MVVALVAMLYSTYALYASGKDAVLGGMLVTAIAFIIWGFIAPRFTPAGASCEQSSQSGLMQRHTVKGELTCNAHGWIARTGFVFGSRPSRWRFCRRFCRSPGQ